MKISLKIIHWLPRVFCIAAISFVSIFSLDAFGHGNLILEQIADFLLHLIPSFVLLFILLLAWKKELVGGVIFLIIGVVFSPIIYNHNYAMNNSVSMSLGIIAIITFPFILIGILFMISYYLKKGQKIEQ